MVCSYRYTSTQVADNQIKIFVTYWMFGVCCGTFLGISAGNGSLVQGMPNSDAGHERRTGDACHFVKFVNNTGVGNECAAVGYFGG